MTQKLTTIWFRAEWYASYPENKDRAAGITIIPGQFNTQAQAMMKAKGLNLNLGSLDFFGTFDDFHAAFNADYTIINAEQMFKQMPAGWVIWIGNCWKWLANCDPSRNPRARAAKAAKKMALKQNFPLALSTLACKQY